MSAPLHLKLDPERIKEMPMVDLAFVILKTVNTPYYYLDLMAEVAKQRGLNEKQMNDLIAQLYTEINIDGRFACVGTNLWGLKRWYPVDRSEDPIANAKRPRIINDDDDDLDDDDFVDEEEAYAGDEAEDFDRIDEDHDDIYSDDDSEEEAEEVVIEDDDLEDADDDTSEDDTEEDFNDSEE
ncbi:DNA-directed RNA polymerase subunit delta [Paenibacillus crassostreae]|uniref:Probable DNA-directed RNA polymerase subunit delta n=1 Tax=Paenibacillus crassostreae TaxID=1763538 RepID=A0A167D4M6_9BACL|nr:DNA-directed RNA polymerase subunit delta [Paenibacillus crassostreae]AOZ92757.1 DNA-directed RNA polymerase subunit delta [Paenibacillus crassostreae]OAB73930.1 DNA-directed RNA polymerase subunit delta [Paenibacillus crassostreae]